MKLKSRDFEHNSNIPSEFTCDGRDVSPQLSWEDAPGEAKSFALSITDPDAPMGTWDHWIVWNIPPTGKIKEGTIPGTEGMNGFRKHSYGGPCPPSGTHRYFFKVYALDAKLELPENSRKHDVEKAMGGHILARGHLVGLYSRR